MSLVGLDREGPIYGSVGKVKQQITRQRLAACPCREDLNYHHLIHDVYSADSAVIHLLVHRS